MAKKKPSSKKRPPPPVGEPYLMYALICETIMEDKDSGAASFIRVLDRITISAKSSSYTPAMMLFNIALGFKSRGFIGEKDFAIRVTVPSGKKKEMFASKIKFSENLGGANAFVKCNFVALETGLHWFAVTLDGKKAGLIPLDIQYKQQLEESENESEGH